MPKQLPIIFLPQLVERILAGKKWQTRRTIEPPILRYTGSTVLFNENLWFVCATARAEEDSVKAPYGPIGSLLWVREQHAFLEDDTIIYRADYPRSAPKRKGLVLPKASEIRWRAAIHMPWEGARIFLRVTGYRIERLQDISNADIIAEGIDVLPTADPLTHVYASGAGMYSPDRYRDFGPGRAEYASLWDSLQSKKTPLKPYQMWDANPYVLVIDFKRVKGA